MQEQPDLLKLRLIHDRCYWQRASSNTNRRLVEPSIYYVSVIVPWLNQLSFDSDVQERGSFIKSKSDDTFLIKLIWPEWAHFQLVHYNDMLAFHQLESPPSR